VSWILKATVINPLSDCCCICLCTMTSLRWFLPGMSRSCIVCCWVLLLYLQVNVTTLCLRNGSLSRRETARLNVKSWLLTEASAFPRYLIHQSLLLTVCRSVCLFVDNEHVLYKNSWDDSVAVWCGALCRPQEWCTRWRSRCPHGKGQDFLKKLVSCSVMYGESVASAVQKCVKQLSCHLGWWVVSGGVGQGVDRQVWTLEPPSKYGQMIVWICQEWHCGVFPN